MKPLILDTVFISWVVGICYFALIILNVFYPLIMTVCDEELSNMNRFRVVRKCKHAAPMIPILLIMVHILAVCGWIKKGDFDTAQIFLLVATGAQLLMYAVLRWSWNDYYRKLMEQFSRIFPGGLNAPKNDEALSKMTMELIMQVANLRYIFINFFAMFKCGIFVYFVSFVLLEIYLYITYIE